METCEPIGPLRMVKPSSTVEAVSPVTARTIEVVRPVPSRMVFAREPVALMVMDFPLRSMDSP